MGAYASIGLRRGAVPTHAQYVRITKAATAAINTPGLAGAEQRLKHWVRAHCPKVPKKRWNLGLLPRLFPQRSMFSR